MRQLFFGFLGALLIFPLSTLSVLAAQDATPETVPSAFADLGLPELNITITSTGLEGIPDETEAGRYLVTVSVAEDVEFGGGVAFTQPVEGMAPEEFLAAAASVGPSEPAGEVPGGTPIVAGDATPVATEGGPPQAIFESTHAGGIFADAGGSAEVVLDLTPGEWIAWSESSEAPQEPVVFTVTGEIPSDLPEPESGATITMGEYVIAVSDGELTTGQQVVKVENLGAQPHFVFVARGPDDMTEEQIAAILEAEMQAEMTGTPPAFEELEINPEEDLRTVLSTGTQSPNREIWVSLDLQAGAYAMVCFFPDISDGIPHAFYGMYEVVEVSE